MPERDPKFDRAKREALELCASQWRRPERLARNLVGAEIDIKIKGKQPLGYECVRFYVERKIKPKEEIDPSLRIPEKLGENVETDVIETRRFVSFQSGAGRSEGARLSVAPGATIGVDFEDSNVDPTRLGTLGAFVEIGQKIYILGANHVLALNGRVPKGTGILFRPPGKFADSRNVFAETTVHIPLTQPGPNYVDCALAAVPNQEEIRVKIQTDFPPGIVVRSPEIIRPKPGMKVIRVDVDERAQAKGIIKCVGCKARIDFTFGAFDFAEMILIEGEEGEFAEPGDSGALIVDRESNQVTAMLVGGSSRYAIASPMSTVYKLLAEAVARQPREGFAQYDSDPEVKEIRLLGTS